MTLSLACAFHGDSPSPGPATPLTLTMALPPLPYLIRIIHLAPDGPSKTPLGSTVPSTLTDDSSQTDNLDRPMDPLTVITTQVLPHFSRNIDRFCF